MKAAISAVGAFLLSGACVAGAADPAGTARAVVERTNAFRKAQGLEPVSANAKLEEAARRFARFMSESGKYGHGADGRRPPERAAAQGYEYCIVSENIAWQYRSSGYEAAAALAGEFVEGWKKSPEHRKNMLDAAVTETGVGVARADSGRYFAVQMFGRPSSAAIRFSVRNRSGAPVDYRAAGRDFSLPPRALRTHQVCRPTEVRIPALGFKAQAEDGARYTVLEKEVRVGALSPR